MFPKHFQLEGERIRLQSRSFIELLKKKRYNGCADAIVVRNPTSICSVSGEIDKDFPVWICAATCVRVAIELLSIEKKTHLKYHFNKKEVGRDNNHFRYNDNGIVPLISISTYKLI
jgi:hypothetical protein